MATFSLRLARSGDARSMAMLSRDTVEVGLGWRWTPQRIGDSIRDRTVNALVAVEGGAVIGFALMKYLDEDAHLWLLAVTVARRRCGVGRALLAWLDDTARVAGITTVHLEVRAGNLAALAFYRRLGYQQCGVLPRYYGGREAAVRMRRHLSGAHGSFNVSNAFEPPLWRPPV